MNDNHYPDVDTDGTAKEQAAEATAQALGTFRAKIGFLAAHILLIASPILAYMELSSETPECTESEMICAFTPGSLGLPLIAIMGVTSAFVVVVYWTVRRNAE